MREMITPILTPDEADVKRDSLRVDIERLSRAIENLQLACTWLRDVDDTDEVRTALTGLLADTYAIQQVHQAELTTLEVQP